MESCTGGMFTVAATMGLCKRTREFLARFIVETASVKLHPAIEDYQGVLSKWTVARQRKPSGLRPLERRFRADESKVQVLVSNGPHRNGRWTEL